MSVRPPVCLSRRSTAAAVGYRSIAAGTLGQRHVDNRRRRLNADLSLIIKCYLNKQVGQLCGEQVAYVAQISKSDRATRCQLVYCQMIQKVRRIALTL